MTIRNKFLMWIVCKALRLQPYKVQFIYEKEIWDPEITKLGFLNNVKHEFNANVDDFHKQLEDEIEKASNE